jgi:hypothetical protein
MSTGKMIQVRNVPARVHRELVRRAKRRGVTLTRYVEELIERDLACEPLEDVLARIEARREAHRSRTPSVSGAELVRQGRDERAAHIDAIAGRARARARKSA